MTRTQEKREQLTENYSIHHNQSLYKQMADLGWLGVTIPEEYGGTSEIQRGIIAKTLGL